jgi:hypothetical protein
MRWGKLGCLGFLCVYVNLADVEVIEPQQTFVGMGWQKGRLYGDGDHERVVVQQRPNGQSRQIHSRQQLHLSSHWSHQVHLIQR